MVEPPKAPQNAGAVGLPSLPDKRPTPKEIVERNLVVFFLTTLLAGFLAGVGAAEWLGRGPAGVAPKQHTLAITRVGLADASVAEGYRLTVYVNGQPYSYPANTLWGSIGGAPEVVAFPLRPAGSYAIQMKALISRGTIVEPAATSQVQEVEAPSAGATTEQYLVGPLLVKYEIRTAS
jgi:hypothetical protein